MIITQESSDAAPNSPRDSNGYVKSRHFEKRQAQRHITDAEVALTLRFGEMFYQGSDRVFFLGKKRIPAGLKAQLSERIHGTTVVATSDCVLVTAYRNPEARRALRRSA